MTDTTRRYPRTLQEAFGPAAHHSQIVEPFEPIPSDDKVVLIACAIAAVVLLAMVVAGWIQ